MRKQRTGTTLVRMACNKQPNRVAKMGGLPITGHNNTTTIHKNKNQVGRQSPIILNFLMNYAMG